MKKYDDKLEKILTAIFGAVGTIAVIINLFVKGVNTEHLLDALKDIAGLVVVIAVFLIASKVFKAMTYSDFKKKFEENLEKWVKQNKYLIDDVKHIEGKENKEFYNMLTKKHHSNIVFQEKPASEFDKQDGVVSVYNKGAFLYTDTKDKQEIIIGLNKSLFLRNEFQDNLPMVAENLKRRIIEFSSKLEFEKYANKNKYNDEDITVSKDGSRILISIINIDKTDENARLLIDLLEYIKTMILALA